MHSAPTARAAYFAVLPKFRVEFDKIRQYAAEYPPSSPSLGLFKNGKLVYFMQRYDIEGNGPETIANELKNVFNEYCSKKGPSVSPENFAKIMYAKACGSKIPLFKD